MAAHPEGPIAPPSRVRLMCALALVSIVAAIGAAYRSSVSGPALYDDRGSILENPTIRSLSTAWFPHPSGWPVSGRPVLNVTFGLNYALSDLDLRGYHLVNILIHAAAACLLFGVLRRTWTLAGASSGRAIGLAWASALLWAVHPLQTESVSYLSQRAESLMGLFYLLCVYGFIRAYAPGTGPRSSAGWALLSVAACAVGVGAKEVMATAPLVLLFYDRIFLAGSWARVWSLRKGVYGCLVATWIPLAILVASTGNRGGTAGFGTGIAPWAYAVTQIRALAIYLKLSVWPHPLLFSYGMTLGGPIPALVGAGLILAILIGATLRGALKGSRVAFLGIWFFGILAPTSSIIPVSTELIAEHRVYLSLAAVTTLVVLAGEGLLSRLGRAWGGSPRVWAGAGVAAVCLAGLLGARATYARTQVYSSVLALWADTVATSPNDAGARNNLGNALADLGRDDEALVQFRAALQIAPSYGTPHHNVGNILMKQGRPAEAAREYEAALAGEPTDAGLHYELGDAYRKLGRMRESLDQFQEALLAKSESSVVWYDLGNAFLDAGRLPEAEMAYRRSLSLRPDFPDALVNHAGILAQLGEREHAIEEFERVAALQPQAADIHNDLGGLLAQSGRFAEAREQFERALAIKPDYREARDNLERVRMIESLRGKR